MHCPVAGDAVCPQCVAGSPTAAVTWYSRQASVLPLVAPGVPRAKPAHAVSHVAWLPPYCALFPVQAAITASQNTVQRPGPPLLLPAALLEPATLVPAALEPAALLLPTALLAPTLEDARLLLPAALLPPWLEARLELPAALLPPPVEEELLEEEEEDDEEDPSSPVHAAAENATPAANATTPTRLFMRMS